MALTNETPHLITDVYPPEVDTEKSTLQEPEFRSVEVDIKQNPHELAGVFSKMFLKDAAERAIATFAETVAALLLVVAAGGGGLEGVVWLPVLSVGTLAAIISLLKSVVASQRGNNASASLVKDI